MKNKFKFLTKDSISKKINTKSFKITNLVLFIIIAVLINLDGIVKFFGGEFNEEVKVYVVDEVGVYDELEATMKASYLDILENYNAVVVKTDKNIETLKKDIIEDESNDIILDIKNVENETIENVFEAELISFEYIDTILYQNIVNALNTVKANTALKKANISNEVLSSIYKNVPIKRTLLDPDLNENEELIEKIGGIIVIVFIVPIFLLIIFIVQMLGAEINEEKSTKSMEIIISSVKPEVHFLSKLVSANLFALIQGLLLIGYALIGCIIRVLTTGVQTSTIVGSVGGVSEVQQYLTMFIESSMFDKLVSGIPLFIILIILTVFAYSLFIGVLASMTTNMEDYNQIQTPIMIFLMIGYYLAIFASIYEGSMFIRVMAYIPFISGILAPVMYTIGEMTLLDLGASILLLVGTCYFLYKYGLKVYKAGILNYSSSKLWSKILKSLKS